MKQRREKAIATVYRMKKLEWFASKDKGDAVYYIHTQYSFLILRI